MHTHTHPFNGLFPGLPRWAGTRKVKPIWILLNQKTVSGSGINWATCKSALCSRQITMPAPHHSVFLQAGCPSCGPTNSIKALKATQSLLLSVSQMHCKLNTLHIWITFTKQSHETLVTVRLTPYAQLSSFGPTNSYNSLQWSLEELELIKITRNEDYSNHKTG